MGLELQLYEMVVEESVLAELEHLGDSQSTSIWTFRSQSTHRLNTWISCHPRRSNNRLGLLRCSSPLYPPLNQAGHNAPVQEHQGSYLTSHSGSRRLNTHCSHTNWQSRGSDTAPMLQLSIPQKSPGNLNSSEVTRGRATFYCTPPLLP